MREKKTMYVTICGLCVLLKLLHETNMFDIHF